MPPTKLKLMGGGVDISLPNVSYCEDVKDVHYTPYNLVRFYVGEISETTPQTVKIYTDKTTSIPIQVSEEYKWYTYVLPKDKGLYRIEGDYVTKVVVKADINTSHGTIIIPTSTIEASFKGSNTSNVTDMYDMFDGCSGLISLNVSSFDTSNVTNMNSMFNNCIGLTSLNLSNFNTSKVTNMRYMFYSCRSISSLDLSSFKTSNVTDMFGMFSNCRGLKSLDLSGLVISDATNTSNMFSGCEALSEIKMVGCSEATVKKIESVKPSSATIVTE